MIFTVINEEEGQETLEEAAENELVDNAEEEVMDEATILNALSGTEVPNTITLKADSKKKVLSVLLGLGAEVTASQMTA